MIQLAPEERGILNWGGLEAAVYAPRNTYHYTGGDLFDLAAVYLVRIARAHAFQTGTSGQPTTRR